MQKPTFDAVNKIWRGPKVNPLYNPDQSLGYLILNILQQTPDAITQISADTDVSLTCKQMHDRTIKIAKFLTKCGIKEGDLIGFVASNTDNLPPIVFACFTLGLPINPLAPLMNESDIVQMFSKTKPKMIFCDAENLKVVQNAINEMESNAKIYTVMGKVDGYECVTEILKEMDDEIVNDFEIPVLDSNSIAAILCSSGSTGSQKGICKSHKQIISNFYPIPITNHQGQPIFLQGSAIFWLSGFFTLITSVLYKYVRVSTAKAFEPQLMMDIINKYKVSIMITPPYTLVSYLQLENFKNLESIQFLFVGGANVSDKLCEKFLPYIPNGKIYTGYGCTEQGIVTRDSSCKNYKSSGFVTENVEVKIIDEDGNSLGPNEHGEICSKIPVKFCGYLDDIEKTIEAFDGEWFKTGDIGYFDNDGYLYVIDRKKELLKYKNYQVTPSEIEAIINEIKGIVSSCVVGVPEPDSGNDIIHAFVILDEGKSLTESFILEYVNGKVIDPKRIRGGVHIVESFPLGVTGKVDRKKVKEMAQKNEFN